MAEVENTVINRPVALLPTLVSLWPIAAAVLTGGGWLYHLEGVTTANALAIVDLRERTKSIEDGRAVGLQRLAAVEEAVRGQSKTLDAQSHTLDGISAKLDRVLMDGRRR